MATLKPLLAKILIQVGADEPKEIGTIEIPIEVSVPTKAGKTSTIVNIQSGPDPAEVVAEVQKRINARYGI